MSSVPHARAQAPTLWGIRVPAVTIGTLAALLALLALLVPLAAASPARSAETTPAAEPVTLELFHGDGCPHCAAERAWLAELTDRYPDLQVRQHEVWYDQANRELLERRAAELGFEPSGVPVTIVGEEFWIGFSQGTAAQIEQVVRAALAPQSEAGADPAPDPATSGTEPGPAVDLPLVGTVDLSGAPLLASTLLIGFADGVNPCSLWVLAVLLAIVLHSGSRGRVAVVGSTFLIMTAVMYALYILGMYSALDYVGQLAWIRYAVAGIAAVFGILQLKDAVRPGTGPSLSVAPSARPRIYRAMRSVSRDDRSLAGALAGTAALAVGVSLLETPCTAGLPLLWTAMLAENNVAPAAAVALFAVYMTVFLIDELVLFAVAVVTMRARRLGPEQGRALKAVSGSLMVVLAAAMILNPQALSGLGSSLAVFAGAAVLGAVVWAAGRTGTARTPRHSG